MLRHFTSILRRYGATEKAIAELDDEELTISLLSFAEKSRTSTSEDLVKKLRGDIREKHGLPRKFHPDL